MQTVGLKEGEKQVIPAPPDVNYVVQSEPSLHTATLNVPFSSRCTIAHLEQCVEPAKYLIYCSLRIGVVVPVVQFQLCILLRAFNLQHPAMKLPSINYLPLKVWSVGLHERDCIGLLMSTVG